MEVDLDRKHSATDRDGVADGEKSTMIFSIALLGPMAGPASGCTQEMTE
jgi:hypothetical protein